MFKTINKEFKVYLLKRKLQTVNAYYDAKISAAQSEAEARMHHREKVNSLFALATRYLEKNGRV
jgi:hypothetical protein